MLEKSEKLYVCMGSLFKTRLKELRLKNNLSQQQLGEVIGTGKQTIYGYEKGRTEPSLNNIIKLAECFGVTVDYLIGKTDHNKPLVNMPEEKSLQTKPQKDISQKKSKRSYMLLENTVRKLNLLKITDPELNFSEIINNAMNEYFENHKSMLESLNTIIDKYEIS